MTTVEETKAKIKALECEMKALLDRYQAAKAIISDTSKSNADRGNAIFEKERVSLRYGDAYSEKAKLEEELSKVLALLPTSSNRTLRHW